MPEALNRLLEPFLALPQGKRWMVGGVVALCVSAFALLILIANKTDYRPLFSNLTSEDAGEIIKKLKEQKVPYQIAADGKAVMVPSDKVYDLRLSLASEGLPQGGGVGFEIFDRKNFGMTEFVQKLNYQRALQGELSRTISQIAGVDQVRVHIVIPEKSLFKDSEKPPTASVVLKMKSSRALKESEVQGVVHLVSSSIEGMDPEHVTILDTRGKVLSKGGASDPAAKMSASMQETQRTYEKNAEERLQTLLDNVVGPGKSAARVSALFDFRQVEKYEEKYDPETTAVRSEQRSEEKAAAASATGGVPGVQSNMGRMTPAAGAGSAGGGSKNDETLNYEVSRMTARTVEPVGTVSKVSVAVLVDGKYDATAVSKDGKPVKPKYAPRSPEELQKIEALVKSAVGFNPDRGDQVTVVNIPFQEGMDAPEVTSGWWSNPMLTAVMKNALIGGGFLALIMFVIRPLVKILKASAPRREESAYSLEDMEHEKLMAAQRAQLAMTSSNQLELVEVVKQSPYQTAQILQNWLEDKSK